MISSRNVIIAVVATCCWFAVTTAFAQGGFRHRFYPRYPSFGFGGDGAQDPNTVDDNLGWSWGAAQGNNQQQQPRQQYNPDFNFNSNEFGGGFNGAAPVATSAPVTSAPPATPEPGAPNPISGTAIVYSDEFYDCLGQCKTTNEWNPICGTDNNNYNNLGKLACANSCGGNVQQLRRGPCRPFGK